MSLMNVQNTDIALFDKVDYLLIAMLIIQLIMFKHIYHWYFQNKSPN